MGKAFEQAKKKLPRSGFVHLARGPTIKLTKMITDTKWISYAYPSRFMNVKPKNQKEVSHENFSSRKNLDRVSRYQLKKNTVRAYRWIINKFCNDFGEEELTELSSEKIRQFLNTITEGYKPQTKRVRFTHLSSFFNFLKNNLNLNFQNPCDVPMMRKQQNWRIWAGVAREKLSLLRIFPLKWRKHGQT